MQSSSRIHFRTTHFLLYMNYTDCELLLYADDTCIIYQHKDITEIETALNKNVSMLCDWLVDKKLSIHVQRIKQNQFCLAENIVLKSENQ